MKKLILYFFLITFCFFNNAFSKNLILECNRGNTKDLIHINTSKQHWLQYNTRKFEFPQPAITFSSKFYLHAEVILGQEDSDYWNSRYNDNANYTRTMILFDIDRYSGAIRGHSHIIDDSAFKKYFSKLRKEAGNENIYLAMETYGEQNDRRGHHFLQLTSGTCTTSEKKF